ncbi:hypothetical protein [Streptomyces sp. DASNCL29]|uniref:hypothetical protein n=1 Tax=Streptomyces sp. DASNCL29 TaxID=2583819 RepID=UPI001F0EB709|nr:hypothetical protein [Streptomyces sp. DASNCL29]
MVSYQRAAVLHRQLGDRSREARAWNAAGEAYGRLGRFDEAAAFHRRAAAAHRELDDHWQLALALDGLASALRGSGVNGSEEEARRHWEEASRTLAVFDDARAVELRSRIDDALGTSQP